MSTKRFLRLARRLWTTREHMDAAHRAARPTRLRTLQRRHDRLQDAILNSAREGVTA